MNVKWTLALTAVGAFFTAMASPAMAVTSCAPPHQMRIVDLDMYPDPVHEGQPVRKFTVTVQSDRNGECLTAFEIRDDGNDVAGRLLQSRLSPGTHQYTIPAVQGYRFQQKDLCFKVVAMVANTHWVPIDGARKECARFKPIQINGWTLNR